jgi:hypothetical protein
MSLMERFQKIDLGLGVINADAKVTQLGAVGVGAMPPYHLADNAELTVTWQPSLALSPLAPSLALSSLTSNLKFYHDIYHEMNI